MWWTPSVIDFPFNSPSSPGHFHGPSRIQQGRPTQTVPYHIQQPMALFLSTVSCCICFCSQVPQSYRPLSLQNFVQHLEPNIQTLC